MTNDDEKTVNSEKLPEKSPTFFCEKCNKVITTKSNYAKHLLTKRHLSENTHHTDHTCKLCAKVYKTASGLWKHTPICESKQMCNDIQNLKQQVKKLESSCTINQTQNINNNINIFLETNCNNALNIDDIFNRIKFSYDDLIAIEGNGSINMLSNAIVRTLSKTSFTERPIHCFGNTSTFESNPNLRIKDNNEWLSNNKSISKIAEFVKETGITMDNLFNTWEQDCGYDPLHYSNVLDNIPIIIKLHEDLNKINQLVAKFASHIYINPNTS